MRLDILMLAYLNNYFIDSSLFLLIILELVWLYYAYQQDFEQEINFNTYV